MKVKFHKGIRNFVPEWQGNNLLPAAEQISADISPILMGDLLEVVDALQRSGASATGVTNPRPIMDAAKEVLPKYVTLKNLESDEGPMDIAAILSYPAFMGLVTELVVTLSQYATIAEIEEKNSNTPLA